MKAKKLISLELSEELLSEAKVVAEEEEISVSALIRTALKSYLDKKHVQQTK